MRWAWIMVLSGCDPGCDPPGSLDGIEYEMFGNVIDFERGPGVYPGYSPINGRTTWSFDWGEQAQGPITITIDQQPFEGMGTWGVAECNTFTARFMGTWVAAGGRTHSFSANGNFLYYDAVIEGALAWNESWSDGGVTGTLTATDAAVSGVQR